MTNKTRQTFDVILFQNILKTAQKHKVGKTKRTGQRDGSS